MLLSFESRTPCMLCSCALTRLIFATVRINKRSLKPIRNDGPNLGWRDLKCPECGTARPDEPATETYTLTAAAAAKVRAYRLRRWPELATDLAVSA